MKYFKALALLAVLATATALSAQDTEWPQVFNTESGTTITIYQPQNETLKGNVLESRAAVAVQKKGDKDPVFGVIWTKAMLNTDRTTNMASLESIQITDVRFPNNPDSSKVNALKKLLEAEIPKRNLILDMQRLKASLEISEQEIASSSKISTAPPKIYFEKKMSVLVLIDGEPKLQDIENTGVKRVVNSAFIILQDPAESKYYINGNGLWYSSVNIKTGWEKTDNLSAPVKKVADELLKKGVVANPDSVDNTVIPQILVSTEPAELIQSKGEPEMASIKGTNLLYVKNSDDHIFMDVTGQQYYTLISGRWYKAANLNGAWSFVASDKLPADFAKIPEGMEKDIVLANVAGTEQAKDAVHDAQVPQTAAVDRNKTTTTVEYDGEPKFSKVTGTSDLEFAENSSKTVLKYKNAYYCVDDGVWFVSSNPKGPWSVSTERPPQVEEIAPESPVYNVKYVYIYDYTPEVVYVGYTPGYMGCYVYGPTIVYGTGYYYAPWYGYYYYPRPVTYGFHMNYNPWTGWSFGFSMSVGGPYGWMSFSFGGYPGWGGHYGGYWGPRGYYPPYHHHCNHYYGRTEINVNNEFNRNNNYYNNKNKVNSLENKNIYNNREGIKNSNIQRPGVSDNMQRPNTGGKPAVSDNMQKPGAGNKPGVSNNMTKPGGANNVYTDRSGNVYKNDKGNWSQYNGANSKWEKPTTGAGNKPQTQPGVSQKPAVNQPVTKQQPAQTFNKNQMNQQMQDRTRGATNYNNYNQYKQQSFNKPSGSYNKPSLGGGGFNRPGGGGGGRR